MSTSRTQLKQAVALRMDEVTPLAGLGLTVDGSDGNPLYELIDGVIGDAAIALFSKAPYWRLPQTPFNDSSEIKVEAIDSSDTSSSKIIRLRVNDSFLRVAEINCKYFQRPITEVFSEQSPEGKRQHNRYLRAGSAKPVGVMSHGKWEAADCREIDCYSIDASNTVTIATDIVASYIAIPGEINDTTGTVESVIPQALIPAFEWTIAGMAFSARGDTNHAAICQQNAKSLIV